MEEALLLLIPPRLSAYTAITALSKNTGTKPAITNVGECINNKAPIAKNCPKAPIKNPTVTAFELPNPNLTAQSIPGTDSR